MQLNPEQRFGFVWYFEENFTSADWPTGFLAPINRDQDVFSDFSNPDREFMYARPASAHPEVVNVAFCDGTMREIAETIDYAVYQQLMTPKGLKAEIPNENPPFFVEVTDGRKFMSKPLNQGDY
jgi:prepilin-type processing-associated H-X9-DG protein